MSKRATIILLSVLGVLVVAAIAVTTVVLVIHQNHKNDVAAADRVAADYLQEVATFREDQATSIGEELSDYESALEAIGEAKDAVPSIGDAPEYGRENSGDYAAAAKVEADIAGDLDALESLAQEGMDAVEFQDAVEVALDRGTPSELLGTGPFSSGQPVRDGTIPAMQGVKDTFEAVEVPEGYEETAELTSAALQHVLDNLNQMAASLDGGESYYFEFAEQYNAAETALDEVESAQSDALVAAVEAFGAGDDLPDSSDPGDRRSEDPDEIES
ncbi:MAG: hypothetical protein P1U38_12015 [Aeromicrobium sp.]|uniref:hypothetical protein n=1 Tax=Aeromicrobium sp. TaxID=1871063 RepID=UPI00262CB934|nr:hypothetical protein [Aeromicrobium sp.]MDF1705491.1 hypothetical protein [Aeromicrobium sp.]